MNSNLLKLATGTAIGQSNIPAASFDNVDVCYYECAECVNRVFCLFGDASARHESCVPGTASKPVRQAARERVLVGQDRGGTPRLPAQWADSRTAWREGRELTLTLRLRALLSSKMMLGIPSTKAR